MPSLHGLTMQIWTCSVHLARCSKTMHTINRGMTLPFDTESMLAGILAAMFLLLVTMLLQPKPVSVVVSDNVSDRPGCGTWTASQSIHFSHNGIVPVGPC